MSCFVSKIKRYPFCCHVKQRKSLYPLFWDGQLSGKVTKSDSGTKNLPIDFFFLLIVAALLEFISLLKTLSHFLLSFFSAQV